MTYDICNNAWNTELWGCSSGSQQLHDSFWVSRVPLVKADVTPTDGAGMQFKMDPNAGPCPYQGSGFHE